MMHTEDSQPFCLFHIYGDHLDPNDVSIVLGVTPDGSGRRGEQRTGSEGRRTLTIRTGYWMLSSYEHTQSSSLDDHLDSIMEMISIDKMTRVPNVDKVRLSIVAGTNDEIGEILLPPRLIEFAASLHAEVQVSIEFDCGGQL